MSARMNWRKASLSTKRSLSVSDESEFRDRDAASRWLARHEKPAKKAGKKSACQVAPDGCSPLTTRGADESVGLIHGWLQ